MAYMQKNRFTLFILFLLLNSTSSSTMDLIPIFNKKFFIATSAFILLNIMGRYLFCNTKRHELLENEIKNSRKELDEMYGYKILIWYSIQNTEDLYIQKSSSPSKLTKALKKLSDRERIVESHNKKRKLKNIKKEPKPEHERWDLELLIELQEEPIKINLENTKVKKFHTKEKKLNHLKNKINLNEIFWKSGSLLCPLIYYNKGLSYTRLSAALLLGSYLIIKNNKAYKNILEKEQLIFSSLNNYENFLKENQKNLTIDFSLISYDDFEDHECSIYKSRGVIRESKKALKSVLSVKPVRKIIVDYLKTNNYPTPNDLIKNYILIQRKHTKKLKEKINILRENEKKDKNLYENILTAEHGLLETQKNSWCASGLAFVTRVANIGDCDRFM